ncbi:50S ribosomal protein L4 [Aeromicrobium sp. YIM 150415]|uniref:50S ribosomal protein L4, sunset domain variant n=1 Tax=Aeromicrobium sp. YIM 150415 TaxID=2803912 RepID=UPI001964A21E|nr:50S ribosomal protein L4 [Aeromicrobium sp. YIM 150415]MBM9462096.1 50S ribosomal protein L4 [Aeromicrobium sp. YIM 150415]
MAQTIDVDAPVDIFDVQVNIPLIHQVVTAQLAAARQGTHDTKTRGEVAGGGKKPYRQKGTGRARQGSIRAPQFAGGGIVHGPTPRNYEQRTNKKMKAAALRGALSDRARAGRVHVVESLITGDKPSTKTALATLRALTARPRVLVVVEREDQLTAKSLRNAEAIALLSFDQLNTYDVLLSDDVVFTQAAYQAFVEARSAEGVATLKLSELAQAAPAAPAPQKAAKPAADAPAGDAPAGATKTQPYGPGSKAPLASGNAPKGHEIKGDAAKAYFVPGGAGYDAAEPEVWFDTAESAEAAGFAPAQEEN